jgi:hypothetical protein
VNIWQIIFLAVWVFGSLALAYYLQLRFTFFQRVIGIIAMFLIAVGAAIVHNALSAVFNFEEPVFFFITLFAPAIAFYMAVILIIRKFITLKDKRFHKLK